MNQPTDSNSLDEAACRFAGGIAHDFSNFLAVISGFAQLLCKQHKDNAELVESLEEILQASDRAATMVDRLGVLAGQRSLDPQPIDLNPLILQMKEVLQQLVGEAIQLDVRLAPAPLMAQADSARVQDALSALCEHVKADLAGVGRITITTAADPTNGHVLVSVQDSGKGLEPDLAVRAFEPFFLKSRLRRGTGLGLPFVHAVVKQHGGSVEVESAPGQGTTFHLSFPSAKMGA
jgi:signal transduction histidine kinase